MTVLFTLNSCKKDSSQDNTIQITGVEFTPNYFTKDGLIACIDADIAAKAMQNTAIKYTMSMSDSWQLAYNATLAGPNKAL